MGRKPAKRSLEIVVRDFEWDDENRDHAGRHGLTEAIAHMVLTMRPLFFPNKRGRRAAIMMIGPAIYGEFWTIPIVESDEDGIWRPITGWPSEVGEVNLYTNALRHPAQARRRGGKGKTTDGTT
jgi:hypothetical protein